MSEVSEKVREAQVAAAELAADRAKEAAKDATAAAATAVKTAAAPGAAAVASGAPKPNEKSIQSRAAARLRRGLGAWEIPLELVKPVHERTPEDAVAAAKACKIARTERDERIAADDEMDADLASS